MHILSLKTNQAKHSVDVEMTIGKEKVYQKREIHRLIFFLFICFVVLCIIVDTLFPNFDGKTKNNVNVSYNI